MARINMETLEKAIAARADGTHAPEPVSEVIARGRRGIFNLFDKDRSGRIDTFKLGACFSVLGIEYNADLLKVLKVVRLRHFATAFQPQGLLSAVATPPTPDMAHTQRHLCRCCCATSTRTGTARSRCARSRWRGAP